MKDKNKLQEYATEIIDLKNIRTNLQDKIKKLEEDKENYRKALGLACQWYNLPNEDKPKWFYMIAKRITLEDK